MFRLIQAGKLLIVLAAAALVGVAVAVACALIGNRLLTAIFGENLAPIDGTLPMILAVWASYLAAALTAILVVALGWGRFVRHR